MENQKKPLLIRLYMASKISKKKLILFQVFAYYGRQHKVFVCDFLCAFAKFVQNSHTYHKKPVKSFAKLGKVNARLR